MNFCAAYTQPIVIAVFRMKFIVVPLAILTIIAPAIEADAKPAFKYNLNSYFKYENTYVVLYLRRLGLDERFHSYLK